MKAQVQRAQNLLDRKNPKPIEALAQLKPLLKSPDAPWPIFHFAGVAYALLNDHERCEQMMRKALEAGSTEPESFHTLSVALYKLENYAEAESFARQAVAMRPDFMKALLNLGQVLQSQARLEEALQVYARANQLDPRNAVIAFKIGSIYQNLGNFDKAKELFEIAAQMDPTYDAPVIERAASLIKTRDFEAGEALLKEFLVRKPNSVEARSLLADSKKDQSLYDEAIALYKGVLDDNPRIPGVRVNYGLCLQEMGRYDEAEKEYLRALEYPPTMMEAMSNYLMVMHYNPERTREYIFEAHKKWDAFFAPAERPERPVPADRSPDRRLRVGFVSGGFRGHPVGWMITRGLEELPVDQFEIYCYTTNNINDKITQRIATRADKWRSVVGFNDAVVANMIREDEIDILVELSGHAGDNRLRAVAMEPAPVIMKWVGGLFNSTGLRSVDYLLSDWHETPEGVEEFYTEKLVRMPDDYICFMPPSYAPDVTALPALENGFVTFGCFNNPSKINPELLGQWARLLARVPGSKLFLKSGQYDSVEFQGRVLAALADAGIDADRVLFEGRSPHEDLLGAYGRVDIALDPWPYSGGLSTCEALWMGVPVVTYPGPTFAGRHSVTHLHNSGLGEMVADSWDAYVDIAAGLADDLEALAGLRARLRDQVAASPLCDGERFGAALSLAFRKVWRAYVDGKLKHDHIAVEFGDGGLNFVSEELAVVETKGRVVETESISSPQDRTSDIDGESTNEEISSKTNIMEAKTDKLSTELTKNGLSVNGSVGSVENEENATGVKNGPTGSSDQEIDKVARYEWKRGNHSNILVNGNNDTFYSVPDSLEVMSTYVMLEQGQWFDGEVGFVHDYLDEGMRIVDIGAGFGAYAMQASKKVGVTGKVYAFEPEKSMRKHLDISKVENGLTNLEVLGRALGNVPGEMGLSQAATPELTELHTDGKDVQVVTFDSWWHFEGKPELGLVKIDVNGREMDVLKGAERFLSETSTVLIISASDAGSSQDAMVELLGSLGYSFFDFIAGVGLLSPVEDWSQRDTYAQNVVAVKTDRVAELMQQGWIHDEHAEVDEPEIGYWKQCLSALPWTEGVFADWEKNSLIPDHKNYYRALDYICGAEGLALSDEEKSTKSRKAVLLLAAAQELISKYNTGEGGVSVALTLVRVLNTLGKRDQAVAVMQKLMQDSKMGQENMDMSLPFLRPIPTMDSTAIRTEFAKWLMVRVVESWLLLKDLTGYLSAKTETKLREVLDGNLECNFGINHNLKLKKYLIKDIEKSLNLPSEIAKVNIGTRDVYIPKNEIFRLKNIFIEHEYSLPQEVSITDDSVIVDIGGNVGAFALYAVAWNENAKIFCFEPNPQVFPLLELNTQSCKNISRYFFGLGNNNETITLYQNPYNTGASSTSYIHPESTKVDIHIKNAIEQFEGIGLKKVDVLKIDTEGAEVAILESLQKYLSNIKIIMLEYHSLEDRAKLLDILCDFTLYSPERLLSNGVGTIKCINNNFLFN